ncbi:MAG: fibronectin type III domain-containing protein [Microbacteriaceae bacterium]
MAGPTVAALLALSLALVPASFAGADEAVNSPVVDAPVVDAPVAASEPAPVETAPVETEPAETEPAESAPVDPAPVDPAPVETAPPMPSTEPTTPLEEEAAAPIGAEPKSDPAVADDTATVVGRSAEATAERLAGSLSASDIPVPANVTTSRPYSDRSVTVTWDAVTVGTATVTYSVRSTTTGTSMVTTVAGPQYGAYTEESGSSFYSVAAVVDGVVGEYSDPVEVTEFRYPNSPSTPTNFVATATGTGIALTWDPSEPDASNPAQVLYFVYLRDHGSSNWVYGWYVGQATSYTLEHTLAPGQSYDVGVWALQDSYQSSFAIVRDIAAGGQPSVPTAFDVEPGDASAVLTWGAPAETGTTAISAYDLQYRISGSGSWANASVESGSTAATITGLTNGTTYVARVRAVNGAGAGDWFESAAFTPKGVPSAVTDVVVQAASNNWYVTWRVGASNGASISEYEVQYRAADDTNGSWESVYSQWTYAYITDLRHGAYDVRVRAINSVGMGPWANTPAPVAFAAAPSKVVNPSVVANDSGMTVSWEAPDDDGGAPITKYTVVYFSGPLFGPGFAPVYVDTTDLSVVVTGLANGTEYSVIVSAFNEAGYAEYDFMTVTPFTFAPTFTHADGSPIDGQLQRGDIVAITGVGAVSGESIEIELHSSPIGLATGVVDANGEYRIEATIPEDAASGAHSLVAIYGTGAAAVTQSLAVTIAGQAPDAPSYASGYGPASAFEAYWPEVDVLEGDEITSHDVQWRLTGSAEWLDISTTEETVILPGIANSLTYEIRARATNAWGTSDWSVTSEAIPSLLAPTFSTADGTPITEGSSVKAGSTVIMTGIGQNPNMNVGIILHSDPVRLGTSPVAADGSYRLVVTIPAATPLGAHELEPFVFNGGSGDGGTRVSITVTAADTAAPAGNLAITGIDAGTLAWSGFTTLALLLSGAALMIRARRRALPTQV